MSPKLSKKFEPVIGGSGPARLGNLAPLAQSNFPESTTAPPIEVPVPLRNLVVECTIRVAP